MFRFFENLVDPYTPYQEHDMPPNGAMRFIGWTIEPFRQLILLNLTMAVLTAAAEVFLIYYLGRLVDLLGEVTPAVFWSTYGFEVALVLIFVVLVRPLMQMLDTALIKNAIQPNVAALGRWRAYKHVLRQPVGWFESDFAGRIGSRVSQMPAALGNFIFQLMNAASFTVAYMVGAGILLASADPQLLIPLIVWILLYGGLMNWSLRRVRPAAKASSAARSKTLGFVVDSFSNIQSVKLFSHARREIDVAVGILEHHRKTYMAENRIVTIMDSGLVVLNGILIAGVVGWALVMWSNETATVGVVAAAGALALRINAMSGWILNAISTLLRDLGVVSEGLETVSQPIGLLDRDEAKEMIRPKGRIEVQGLTHHYARGQGGLANVSFAIEPGERIGIVGRSGAGKSTLVKAMLRLFDPEGGRILIDGQDIRDVTQESLRAHIGMVQQETSLLHRTIRDNILYGRPHATEAEYHAAIEKAGAQAFIPNLVDGQGNRGHGAQVGERGVKLSGGQRQRIALARVLLKDAPILILDEATSALDSESEAYIQKALEQIMEGKTVVAIAHRLSTIAHMDRIVVLDDGEIAEQGTHDDLLAKGGLYAGFWSLQSGGFLSL